MKRGASSRQLPDNPDPVSILLPFSGNESNSSRTLATIFGLTYPAARLIFCAPGADEPSVPIVRRLIAEHDRIDATLLIGRERVSANPKLDNLDKGWALANTDWIIIADCNILIPSDYVQELMAAWQDDTGLVTVVPIGTNSQSLWSDVECAFLNTYQARLQLAADNFGFAFAHGKTMLFRRSMLERFGGLRSLAFAVAEDSAATKLVRAAGLGIRLIDRPVEQPLGDRSFCDVWHRQLRWAQIRRHSFPRLFAAEMLSTSVLPVLAAMTLAWSVGWSPLAAAAAGLVVWLGVEAGLARAAGWHIRLRYLLACVVRDLLIAPIWFIAWFRTTYRWRGNAVDLKHVIGQAPPCDGGPPA